ARIPRGGGFTIGALALSSRGGRGLRRFDAHGAKLELRDPAERGEGGVGQDVGGGVLGVGGGEDAGANDGGAGGGGGPGVGRERGGGAGWGRAASAPSLRRRPAIPAASGPRDALRQTVPAAGHREPWPAASSCPCANAPRAARYSARRGIRRRATRWAARVRKERICRGRWPSESGRRRARVCRRSSPDRGRARPCPSRRGYHALA